MFFNGSVLVVCLFVLPQLEVSQTEAEAVNTRARHLLRPGLVSVCLFPTAALERLQESHVLLIKLKVRTFLSNFLVMIILGFIYQ